MFSLYDQLPSYLLGKYQLTATVIFAALFSLVLILLTTPFIADSWFESAGGGAFPYTVAFFMLSIAIVTISKRLMYGVRNLKSITYLQFICWNFAETLVLSLLYLAFTFYGVSQGVILADSFVPYETFFNALAYAVVSLGIPYVIASLYFALEDKENTIRLMNYGNVVSDEVLQPYEQKRITLFDNNGVLKFSISSKNLYLIESDDNYIQVWYVDSGGNLKQYMLRCRLKTVEDSFADSDLVRCHRKYMVNMAKVAVLKSEKDGYYIDLDIDSLAPIPVSKTYEQAVLSRFNSR